MTDHHIGLSVEGAVNKRTNWIAECCCGWSSGGQRSLERAETVGDTHMRASRRALTVVCDGCGDIVPQKMASLVLPDWLCPECFDQVEPIHPPSSAVIVEDLRMLEQELRPVPWDGQ